MLSIFFSDHITLDLDPDTAHRKLLVSENNRSVRRVAEEQDYPDHPERFRTCPQLLCSPALPGRCYWELDWSGLVSVSVSQAEIHRAGDRGRCTFGDNLLSWRLMCSSGRFTVCHDSRQVVLASSASRSSGRVAVFLDRPAGSLQFYRVVHEELIHLHTFSHTFTEPLFAGFGVWSIGSTLKLRDTSEEPENS